MRQPVGERYFPPCATNTAGHPVVHRHAVSPLATANEPPLSPSRRRRVLQIRSPSGPLDFSGVSDRENEPIPEPTTLGQPAEGEPPPDTATPLPFSFTPRLLCVFHGSNLLDINAMEAGDHDVLSDGQPGFCWLIFCHHASHCIHSKISQLFHGGEQRLCMCTTVTVSSKLVLVQSL